MYPYPLERLPEIAKHLKDHRDLGELAGSSVGRPTAAFLT
jgi:hypothetical protein